MEKQRSLRLGIRTRKKCPVSKKLNYTRKRQIRLIMYWNIQFSTYKNRTKLIKEKQGSNTSKISSMQPVPDGNNSSKNSELQEKKGVNKDMTGL